MLNRASALPLPKPGFPKVVYFVPTISNSTMVDHLRRMAPLTEVEFRPLVLLPDKDPDPFIQSDLLSRLFCASRPFYQHLASSRRIVEKRFHESLPNGQALFIWGDGYQHHLSAHFDLPSNGVPVFKLNIDSHDDFFVAYGGLKAQPTYHDHMFHSNRRPNHTACSFVPSRAPRFHGTALVTRDGTETNGSDFEFPANSDLHVTIDLDSVKLFPAVCEWVAKIGFDIDLIIAKLVSAKQTGHLMRVDFGGLIDSIPQFDYLPHLLGQFKETTTLDQVEKLTSGVIFSPENKHLANLALTHALDCYYRIIKTVLFD